MEFFRELVEQSLNRTREATLSVLGINDTALRQHLAEAMSNELGAEGCFLAPPVFEHTFGWEQASKTLADLQDNLLSSAMLNTLDSAGSYQFPKIAHPYTHQLQAWEALLDDEPKSAVITSGTGSGKTECFMVPIIEDLIRERNQSNRPLVGIRALFLYPLNALINSQQERLDAWTRAFGEDIRFCLYNGKTEEQESSVRRLQAERPNQVLSRERLRKEPAPIVMTNATMLEYMLVRQVDSPILEISRKEKSLRWIVLDEAHTYIGSQAAELSLLLRRVVQAFGKEPEEIRFVATSATIADKNASERLKQYLADLAGVRRDQVIVIGGNRTVPELAKTSQRAATSLKIDEIRRIDSQHKVSPERYQALCAHPVALQLRSLVVGSPSPMDLNDLVHHVQEQLTCCTQQERQREVLDWLDLMTGTHPKAGALPFLKLRIHLFQRMLHGLWACVDSACSAKSGLLCNWPFGNVYVSQRMRCQCGAPVYELAFCDDCKTPHLLAEETSTGALQQQSPFTGDEFALNYESPEDGEVLNPLIEGRNSVGGNKLVLAGRRTAKEPYEARPLDLESLEMGALRPARKIDIILAEESRACCSYCDYVGLKEKNFLRKSYLGAPFYVANAVPTVLEFCPDPDRKDTNEASPEELPGRGRKLITFTDSRQGTARMAIRMQQEAERSRLRGLAFEVLRNAQVKADAEPKDEPTGSYEDLMAQAASLEKMGMGETAKHLRITAEAAKSGIKKSTIHEVKWQTVLDELASSKDISQSILDYNRYANPELFGGNEAGTTMARLLLAREYARRPRNQNSTETLGLIKVNYLGLEQINSTPQYWLETKAKAAQKESTEARSNLTLQDWKDFLKVALDFYVRENTFIRLDPGLQRWMGSRFTSKALYPPTAFIEEDATNKRWPQIKPGSGHRLVRLLELATGLDRNLSTGKDKINYWLQCAWSDLVDKAKVLDSVGMGYSLNLQTLTFSLPREAWVCPATNRLLDTTFRGLTPYLPRKLLKNNDYRCQKTSLPDLASLGPDSSPTPKVTQIRNKIIENQCVKRLRQENLWTDLSDRTAEGGFYYRTAEHSAQQSSKKLEDYEAMFKMGKINVLNCSTTMEMGVDIGGVSAVVMNNVPPHPANYLQRAGRAGRRSEARAIAYTLCKADPHNQRAFTHPKWPFVTAIPAPSVTLSSNRIVQRHVNSLLLGIFLRARTISEVGDRTKLTVKWFFGGGEEALYHQFADWLESLSGEEEIYIRRLVKGTGLEAWSVASIIEDTLSVLYDIAERWSIEYEKLNSSLAAAKDEPYKKALSLELKRHEDEYLLRDLAGRTFLPGYGFPTNVVNLNTNNVEDFKEKTRQKQGGSREDNIFTLKEQPTRGLDVAIREYAPGSQIVIDGRVYRSAGISLHWHSGGAVNEAQKFDIAWRCSNCGTSDVVENAYANSTGLTCPHCGVDITLRDQKRVLWPAGFVTDFYEPTSNDITSQKFIRVERPRVQLKGDALSLPDPRCGYIRFGHEGRVFYHSSGEHERGYAVCLNCGRAESMLATGELPSLLRPDKNHRPIGGKAGSHKDKDCSGNEVLSNIYLGYHTQTDVLEFVLRSPATSQWLSDSSADQVIASTVAVALRDTIADLLGIAATEMGFGIRLDKDHETGAGRSIVQLYDQVSGGAGFVLAGLDNIVELLSKASDKLRCPAGCDNVCSCCLAGQDSRVELQELDRKAAQRWFADNGYFEHLALPAEFDSIPGASYCSFDPKRLIRSAIKKGASSIHFALQGEAKDWDLNLTAFRNQLLALSVVDGVQVRLGVPDIEKIPEEMKYSFALLERFGIQLFALDQRWEEHGVPLLIQACKTDGSTVSLFSYECEATKPGESWLHSSDSSVWVSSSQLPMLSISALDLSGWETVEAGASVLECTTELNGRLTTLPDRLNNLLLKQVPEFKKLIEKDQAVTISYSDRYLKSPWAVMVLGRFLALFSGESLNSVTIQTLAAGGDPREGRILKHDWQFAFDQENCIKLWLGRMLATDVTIQLKDKPYDLQHSRVIYISWASGKSSKIILDQGVGYWKPRMPYKEDLAFDFGLDAESQMELMQEKENIMNMYNGGQWPTLVTVT
ncbi:DEAD/DEAH box helicase [Halomonas shantousis]